MEAILGTMPSKDLEHPFSTEAGWVIGCKPSPILAACGACVFGSQPSPPIHQTTKYLH